MLSLSLNHLPRPSPVGTLRGHNEIVWSVVFLPNGKELVSASNDGSIRLWHLDHESEVILGNSNGAVFCLALFPDGKRFASGGLDRSVNIWDIGVLAAVDGPWKGHTSSVRYLDISSDSRYLASGSFDHKVTIWDTESGQIVRDEAYGFRGWLSPHMGLGLREVARRTNEGRRTANLGSCLVTRRDSDPLWLK